MRSSSDATLIVVANWAPTAYWKKPVKPEERDFSSPADQSVPTVQLTNLFEPYYIYAVQASRQLAATADLLYSSGVCPIRSSPRPIPTPARWNHLPALPRTARQMRSGGVS